MDPQKPNARAAAPKPSDVWRNAEAYLGPTFAGDREARDALVRAIAPLIQVRVYQALRARRRSGRDARQEVEDLTQDVLVALFDEGARALRRWDPERGMSFPNYVGLIAERHVGHLLQSRRRSPWSLEPTEDEALDRSASPTEGAEPHVTSRHMLGRVWEKLKDRLTPRSFELFQRLFLEDESVERVSGELGMQPASVYAWRSRFMRSARATLDELELNHENEEPTPSSVGSAP